MSPSCLGSGGQRGRVLRCKGSCRRHSSSAYVVAFATCMLWFAQDTLRATLREACESSTARKDWVDESLLLGEWGSERKRVELQGFLPASLILSL